MLNGGILQPYIPFDTVSVDLFDRLAGANLRGTFLGVQQALRHLRPQGSCVLTASLTRLAGFGEAAAYAISKYGLVGLVRCAAAAFASRSLRIHSVCPGMVLSGMTGGAQRETLVDPDALSDPDCRGGLDPQFVAEVMLFLPGRSAAVINGQAQKVDAAFHSAFPPLPEDALS